MEPSDRAHFGEADLPEVAVTIGPENGTTTITVSISDDNGWSPDQLDDACRRAGTEAIRLHRDVTATDSDGA